MVSLFYDFYAVMGLPIARLADTKSRPVIIAIGIAVWSIATAVCGTAKSFFSSSPHGGGVGEAALSPAAYSMITDAFQNPSWGGVGCLLHGLFFGAGLAYIIGGVAIEMVTKIGIVEMPIIGTVKPGK